MGKPDSDIAPRQCTVSRVAPHLQLSVKTSDIRCTPSTLFSGLSPSTLFFFPKLKTTLKGHCFQTTEENQENAIENCVPSQKGCSRKHSNNGRNGNGLSPVEGTTLKGTVLKCCKMSNKTLFFKLYHCHFVTNPTNSLCMCSVQQT